METVSGPPPNLRVTRVPQTEVSRKLAALSDLTAEQLRGEWRRAYRSQSPRLSRDLLVRMVAYRIQELACGALSKASQRQLLAATKELESNGYVVPDAGTRLKPGTKLIREWHGRTHTVTVAEDGFEYAGKAYTSLTKIAQAITGAHWSGPRFFGLGHQDASGDLEGRIAAGEVSHG